MPVSVYYGDETFLLTRAVNALRARIVDPAMEALSYKRLDRPSIGQALEAVGAPSLCLGGGSLLELRHFAPLEEALDSDADKAQLESLMTLLGDLPPGRHALFVSSKIDRKVKFAKWLTTQADVDAQEFKTLPYWETDKAMAMLIRLAKESEAALTPEAARILVEQRGTALQPLMNEVNKLALYARGRTITAQDVRTLCDHDENAFQMLRSWLLDQPRGPVFATLDELLSRQHTVPLYAMAQSHLGRVYSLKLMQRQGLTYEAMGERVKTHPFKVRKDLESYASVPLSRLEALSEKALDLEWRAKTGQLEGRLSLELLLGS